MEKLSAENRIDQLFDRDTAVYEYSSDRSVLAGTGEINGTDVAFFVQDFSVKGGSITKEGGRFALEAMQNAFKNDLPFISVYDSGGARLEDGVHALYGVTDILKGHAALAGKVPQVALVLGPCAGGSAYGPNMCDFVFMVDGISQMFVTGPGVIRRSTGEATSLDELGGAAVHSKKTGNCHFLCETEKECFEKVRQLFKLITQKKTTPADQQRFIVNPVPKDPKQPYDIRNLILQIADDHSFMELQKDYAPNAVCGLSRVGGYSCGILADQPSFLAGTLDVKGSEKAARFIKTMDSIGLPLIVLTDTPGFLPGTDQEHHNLLSKGAVLFQAFENASVPVLTIILRKAYGGAYIVMAAKTIGRRFCYMWDGAQLGVMQEDAAIEVLYKKDLRLHPDDPSLREKFKEEYLSELPNMDSLIDAGYIDAVIQPEETRNTIITKLKSLG